MKSENKTGIIYSVENTITRKIYIGATTNSMHQRRLDHNKRVKRGESNKFQEAIGTYGPEAFSWTQIDTANCIDELAQKEKQYILDYNSKKDGYNSDSGGGFKKTVYQYDLKDGSLVNKFDNLQDAGKVINATKKHISRACLSVNKLFNGYYWSYDLMVPFEQEKSQDQRKKEICQFTLDGDLLANYTSISEAARLTEINKSSIAKVCRKERNHAGGFIWKNK